MSTDRNPHGFHASHLGRWDWNDTNTVCRWIWDYDPEWVTVVDTAARRWGGKDKVLNPKRSGTFTLRIIGEGDDLWPTTFTVRFCGPEGKGGTRYHYGVDIVKAQTLAFRWLDSRFKADTSAFSVTA